MLQIIYLEKNRMMASPFRILVFLPILLFLIISCKEDTIQPELFGSIEGKVIEARQDSLIIPISNASVTTAPATTSTTTDDQGNFAYSDIRTGSYTISVDKVGFQKKSVTVSVSEDEITQVTIQLEKSPPAQGPDKATDPFPEDEAIDQERNLDLAWIAPEVDPSFKLKYDVYFYDFNSPMPEILAQDIEDTTVSIEGLDYSKSYFWRVDSKLEDTLVTQGDVWTFTVRELPDYRFFYSSKRNGNYDIFNSDSVGTDVIQLTSKPFREWWPRLSPNRRYIAYISDESNAYQIFKMNRDGSDQHQVTTIPIAGYHNNGIGFSWSPDNGKFIYAHYNELYTINENGSDLTLIATAPAGRHFKECEFSPIGDKIAVVTIGEEVYDSEIYIMNSNGTGAYEFVENFPGIVAGPSWSIDGTRLLFTRDVSGINDPTGRQYDARVFLKGISDSVTVEISVNKPAGTNDTNPRFSPDGAYVIFENAINDGFNPKDIWIMDVGGTNRRLLISNAETPDYK